MITFSMNTPNLLGCWCTRFFSAFQIYLEFRLKPTWDWLLTVMDATEAQLKFGASLTNSLDSGGTGGNTSGAGGAASGGGPGVGSGAAQQHAATGGGSGGGHRQVPAPPLLASLAALG